MLETLRETVRLLFFRSYFSPSFMDRHPKPPEAWNAVMERLEGLYPDEHTDHISVLHRGTRYPFSSGILSEWQAPPTITFEDFGLSKSGKSGNTRKLSRVLRALTIHHIFWPEYRPFEISRIRNPVEINLYRAQRSGAAVRYNAVEQTQGIDLRRAHNFIGYEAGFVHSLIYAGMLEKTTGQPSETAEIASIVRRRLPYLTMLMRFRISPEESARRGSRMGTTRLNAWHEALEESPEHIARLDRRHSRPLVWMDIDTQQYSSKAAPAFIARSLGTVLRGYAHA